MINYNYIKQTDRKNVARLMYILKRHSPETYLHSIEVANINLYLAKASCMDFDSQCILYTAGCLHDIGKISISPTLLHKKSSNPIEVNYIRNNHIYWTYKILRKYFDSSISDLCFHHHERLNGLGYPQGLRANQLNDMDRIIVVSDIASAMLLDRSYRDHNYTTNQVIKVLNNLVDKKAVDNRFVVMIDGYLKMAQYKYNINNKVLPDEELKFNRRGQLEAIKKCK